MRCARLDIRDVCELLHRAEAARLWRVGAAERRQHLPLLLRGRHHRGPLCVPPSEYEVWLSVLKQPGKIFDVFSKSGKERAATGSGAHPSCLRCPGSPGRHHRNERSAQQGSVIEVVPAEPQNQQKKKKITARKKKKKKI